MINIFVSYRREDSRHQTGRLYDRLVQKFGDEQIFKDVDSIPFGLDFRQILSERVACCDVLIAVIGDDWLSITDKSGNRRLEDPGDFVRIEIEAALSRQIPVIPVLVGEAGVPGLDDLPQSLRDLSFRNGLAVRPDPDFHNDVTRLILGIEKVVSTIRERSTSTRASPPFATESPSAELDLPPEPVAIAEPPPTRSEPLVEVVAIAEPPPTTLEPAVEAVAEPPPTIPEPVVKLPAPAPASPSPVPEPEPAPNRSSAGTDGSSKYRIIRPLGSGGKGAAYLAEEELSKIRVALKFPALGSKISDESRARFLEQARAASTLEHPNLCPVLEAGEGEVDHRLFLTRTYIEGESLADWARNQRLTPRHAATMVGKLAIALREAHGSGVIHGNLKTSNVIVRKLTDRIEPMIVDFGLAWVHATEAQVDHADDIRALGAILDELLTSLSQAVEPALDAIRRKAMADRAGDRYSKMSELAADLKGYVRSRPADPLPVSSKPAPSTPLKTYERPTRKTSEELPESESPSWLDDPQTSRPRPMPKGQTKGKWVPPPPPPPPLPDEPQTSRNWFTWARVSLVVAAVGLLWLVLYLFGIFQGNGPSSVKANSSSPPTLEPSKDLTNSIAMKFALISPGEFAMGAPDSDQDAAKDEKPQHTVRIVRPFYLGVFEVTQAQYRSISNTNPSQFVGSDQLPVENVSWADAVDFCNELSRREGFDPYYLIEGTGEVRTLSIPDRTGYGYRLPTEAEWEYACRAGGSTRFCFGDSASQLGRYAWFGDNSEKQTHVVGGKLPNAWGLHDMHGNVFEWCGDQWDSHYYEAASRLDPTGPPISPELRRSPLGNDIKVFRGGCWLSGSKLARSSCRLDATSKTEPGRNVGFRVARF